MACTISGTAGLPSGVVYPSATFTFTRLPKAVVAQGGRVVPPSTETVTSDGAGAVSFDLLPGNYSGEVNGVRFQFSVPEASTATFADCVSAASVSPTPDAILDARASRDAAAASAAAASSSAAASAASAASVNIKTFSTRALGVTWAGANTPATGALIQAVGTFSRYIGTGTAIADMPGWVTNTPYYKSRAELIAATVQDDVTHVWVMDRLYVRDAAGTALTSNAGAVKWSPAINASPVDWGGVANAADNTTSLQGWVSWLANAAAGLEGFLPAGEWKSTAVLTFSGVRSRVIRGVGGNIIGNGSRLSYGGTSGDAVRGSVQVLSCLNYEFKDICFINRCASAPYHVVVSANASPGLSSHFIKFRQCSFIDGSGASITTAGILLSSAKFVELDGCNIAYSAHYGVICGEDDNTTIITGTLAVSVIRNCMIFNDLGLYRVASLTLENCSFESKTIDGGAGCVVPLGELKSSQVIIRTNAFIDDGAKTETRPAITTSPYAGTTSLTPSSGWVIEGNSFRNRLTGIYVKGGGVRIGGNIFQQRSTPAANVGIRIDAACDTNSAVVIDPSNDFSMALANGMVAIEDNRTTVYGSSIVYHQELTADVNKTVGGTVDVFSAAMIRKPRGGLYRITYSADFYNSSGATEIIFAQMSIGGVNYGTLTRQTVANAAQCTMGLSRIVRLAAVTGSIPTVKLQINSSGNGIFRGSTSLGATFLTIEELS